jgi:hypothetical protein
MYAYFYYTECVVVSLWRAYGVLYRKVLWCVPV